MIQHTSPRWRISQLRVVRLCSEILELGPRIRIDNTFIVFGNTRLKALRPYQEIEPASKGETVMHCSVCRHGGICLAHGTRGDADYYRESRHQIRATYKPTIHSPEMEQYDENNPHGNVIGVHFQIQLLVLCVLKKHPLLHGRSSSIMLSKRIAGLRQLWPTLFHASRSHREASPVQY